jgi:hypothetical protein
MYFKYIFKFFIFLIKQIVDIKKSKIKYVGTVGVLNSCRLAQGCDGNGDLVSENN